MAGRAGSEGKGSGAGMSEAEIAAENDKQMGDFSICRECALANGGKAQGINDACTHWIGTCIVCHQAKACCHVRDWKWPGGIRPTQCP